MESCSIFGMRVDNVTLDETLEKIDELVKFGGTHLIVTLGVEMIMRAEKDKEFIDIVNSASLVTPDTIGVVWACNKAGISVKDRVPGIDVLYKAAREAEKYNWRAFFLGAAPEIAEKAAQNLKKDYPNFNIVGTHHGYFKDDAEVLEKIKKAQPDIIFIAMGSPAQERWFINNAGGIGKAVAIGVGGSFDVISGTLKRAPDVFKKLGLEWFYRLISQPSRYKRMLVLPVFALRVLFKGVK